MMYESLVCHDFHPGWPGLQRTFWASQLDSDVAMETSLHGLFGAHTAKRVKVLFPDLNRD